MDFRQLRYALTLSETLNFRRAAEREHIAQSSFSEHISRLEREVGAPLFERSSHRVRLTAAGALFVARAEETLKAMHATAQEVREIHQGIAGRLRIGLFAEGAAELTPLMMRLFRAASPGVQLEFSELSFATQVSALVDDVVDVAVVRPPIADARIAVTELFREPRSAALPVDHPLAGATDVSVQDLLDDPVVDAWGPERWASFWSCDAERGERGRPAAVVRSVSESLAAVAHLGAVDTCPASATRHFRPPGVRFVPIRDVAYASVAVAARRDDARPAVRAFRETAQHAAARHLDAVPLAVAAAG